MSARLIPLLPRFRARVLWFVDTPSPIIIRVISFQTCFVTSLKQALRFYPRLAATLARARARAARRETKPDRYYIMLVLGMLTMALTAAHTPIRLAAPNTMAVAVPSMARAPAAVMIFPAGFAARAAIITGASTAVSTAVAIHQVAKRRRAESEALNLRNRLGSEMKQSEQLLTTIKLLETKKREAQLDRDMALTSAKLASVDLAKVEDSLEMEQNRRMRQEKALRQEEKLRKEVERLQAATVKEKEEVTAALEAATVQAADLQKQAEELKAELTTVEEQAAFAAKEAKKYRERTDTELAEQAKATAELAATEEALRGKLVDVEAAQVASSQAAATAEAALEDTTKALEAAKADLVENREQLMRAELDYATLSTELEGNVKAREMAEAAKQEATAAIATAEAAQAAAEAALSETSEQAAARLAEAEKLEAELSRKLAEATDEVQEAAVSSWEQAKTQATNTIRTLEYEVEALQKQLDESNAAESVRRQRVNDAGFAQKVLASQAKAAADALAAREAIWSKFDADSRRERERLRESFSSMQKLDAARRDIDRLNDKQASSRVKLSDLEKGPAASNPLTGWLEDRKRESERSQTKAELADAEKAVAKAYLSVLELQAAADDEAVALDAAMAELDERQGERERAVERDHGSRGDFEAARAEVAALEEAAKAVADLIA